MLACRGDAIKKRRNALRLYEGGTDGTNKHFFKSAVFQSVGVGFASFGGQMGDKLRFVSFCRLEWV